MTVAQVLEHYTFIKAVCAGRSLPARVLRTTPMAFLFYLFNVADVAVEGRQLLHSRLYLIEYTCVHGGRKAVALIAQAHALEIEIGLYILWCSRHLVLLVAFALHCVPLQRRCVYHSPEALRIRHGMGAKSVHHLKVGAVHAAAVAVATPCCPAPVSAMTRVLPIFFASRHWPRALLILWAPVWFRSSRFR